MLERRQQQQQQHGCYPTFALGSLRTNASERASERTPHQTRETVRRRAHGVLLSQHRRAAATAALGRRDEKRRRIAFISGDKLLLILIEITSSPSSSLSAQFDRVARRWSADDERANNSPAVAHARAPFAFFSLCAHLLKNFHSSPVRPYGELSRWRWSESLEPTYFWLTHLLDPSLTCGRFAQARVAWPSCWSRSNLQSPP